MHHGIIDFVFHEILTYTESLIKSKDYSLLSSLDSAPSVAAGCEMSAWSPWSGCSVTCGKGISMRERQYMDPFTADNTGCDYQMVEKEMCSADVGVCQGKTCLALIFVVNMLVQEVL